MIVFNNYSIFIVTFFILSFRRINAPTNQPRVDKQELRKNCIEKINSIFKDEDLYQHGVIAINQFELIEVEGIPDENHLGCVYSIPGTDDEIVDSSDIFGYYYSFKNKILSNGIPKVQDICNEYSAILENPVMAVENCINHLTATYTGMINIDLLSDAALLLSNMANDLGYIQYINDQEHLDISLAYFTAIKWSFVLVNDASNNEEEGFLTPPAFCEKRYITPN